MAAVTQQVLLAGSSATRTYLNNRQENTTAGSSFTFSNVNTGGAGLLVVAVAVAKTSAATVTINSVTVAGSSTTIHIQDTRTGSNSIACMANGLCSINSPGGTQTIVVNMSATSALCAIDLWVLNNLISTTPTTTASGHNSNTATGDTSVSTSVTRAANGVLIASLTEQANKTLSTTNVTFDTNATIGSGAAGWATGSDQHTASGSVSLVNTDATPLSVGRITVAAAWH